MKLNNGIDGDGFAIVPTRFSSEQIASVAKALTNSPLPHTRAGIRHAMRDSVVVELANSAELLQIARAILGGHAIPFRATLFDKSPAANWLVVWHQDTALPLRQRREYVGWGPWSVKDDVTHAHAPACALEQIVALRVHLDDSCSENGPLRVLPGDTQCRHTER